MVEHVLINGRTTEEIKAAVLCTENGTIPDCPNCPYYGEEDENGYRYYECHQSERDLIAYVEHLEALQPKWISVKERLPEDCKDVLVWAVYHEEHGRSWELIEVDAYCKGVGWENTADPDVREVTHWMPLPESPEEEENASHSD